MCVLCYGHRDLVTWYQGGCVHDPAPLRESVPSELDSELDSEAGSECECTAPLRVDSIVTSPCAVRVVRCELRGGL